MTHTGTTPTEPSRDAPPQASRRIKVTLPAVVAQKLERLAMRAGEPPAKAAAQMIRQALADVEHGKPARHPRARQHADPAAHDSGGRPPWLEPYGGSREWRGLTWAAIVGLRTRYPETLSALREGWWQNPSHLETLSALAVWRQSIDDAGRDPREELSFQIQLANYGKLLQQQSGSILNRWEPGAPPVEWS